MNHALRTVTSRPIAVAGIASVVLVSACGNDRSTTRDATSQAYTPSSATPRESSSANDDGSKNSWSEMLDPHAIPLGDGMTSTEPRAGSLYSCKTHFGGRGAPHGGPWIDEANGTWDLTAKPHVEGANTWPQAEYREVVQGDVRRIAADDLPTEERTGHFPIAESDPVHQYDPNPNSIEQQAIDLSLPAEPTDADSPSCVDMGPVGVLKNGVYLYNAVDAAGGDAVAHEIQDVCDGHPDGAEFYHYHDIPTCLLEATPKQQGSTLVGYALDGYGIYVERDSNGNLPTNADLDACHGRTSTVRFNGKKRTIYHYSATLEFPFTVGCYRGDPVSRPAHEHG